MKLRAKATFVAPLLAACASSASPPPPPPPPAPPAALAITFPADTAVAYVQGDTAVVEIEAEGQTFTLDATSAATLDVEFARAGEGVRVTAGFRELDARISNPMAPPQSATEEQISGPIVFTLDRRGVAQVLQRPEMTPTAAEFVSAEQVAATLFPRLPARAVDPGDSWTDTIRVEAQSGPSSLNSRAVLTYVVVGDTVVAGRTLLLVRFSGTTQQVTQSAQAATEVTQDVSGTTEGSFLWDLERGLLEETESRSELTGSMHMMAAPIPLSVRIRSRSSTRLTG